MKGTVRLHILAIALCITVSGAGCSGKTRSNMSGFDAALWKAQHDRDETLENPRASMVGSLIDVRLQTGMTRAAVLELLGPPEFQRNGNDYYTLGRAPYGIDYEYLVVHYEQDKVTLAKVERG